mgnify:CR=1 FL=1
MPGEFASLYHELTKLTPMTKALDTDFKKQRIDVLQRLGMMGNGKDSKSSNLGPIRQLNKNLGKKARQRSHESRQTALHVDNKAVSQRKMEVHAIVHEVEEKMKLSKDLSTFVKAKKDIPPRLLRQLLGKSSTRKSAILPPIANGKQQDPTHKITVPREAINIHSYTSNRWNEQERIFLLELYREIEKPRAPNVDLWKIYYSRLADRFRALYPQRKQQEIISKLENMISKRQVKDVREVHYWSKVKQEKETAIINAKQSYYSLDSPSKAPSNITTIRKKNGSVSHLESLSQFSSSQKVN